MAKLHSLRLGSLLAAVASLSISPGVVQAQPSPSPAVQNVVLVMTDGLRWQEIFRGADPALLTPDRNWNGRSVDALKQHFLAPTAEERRRRLMPFVWEVLVPQGEIFGDHDAGSVASVTNGLNFSYPGYSETLTGHPDPRIRSNDNVPNPNITVLEWLNRQPAFAGTVAAFGAWDVIAGIVNQGRCGFPVNAGYEPFVAPPVTPELSLLNALKAENPRVWDDETFDPVTFHTAMEYIRLHHPRVLFLSLGETDDWAHAGNYGEYLQSAHRVDADLKTLWDTLQSMPQYRGKTSLIFTTDHGRGSGKKDWNSHGEKIPDSRHIFIGLLGPGIPSLGVRPRAAAVYQNQIAANLAALLGQDWNAAESQAGRPLPLQ